MSDITTTIDTYLEAYGEADAARRTELIERVWAADGELVDPPLDAAGHDAIGDMAAAVQGQFPGHRFRRSTDVDAHHGFARYGWELVGGGRHRRRERRRRRRGRRRAPAAGHRVLRRVARQAGVTRRGPGAGTATGAPGPARI